MVLNLHCADGGYAAVELLDDRGEPIPGFTRQDCDRLAGDAVTQLVGWRGSGRRVAALAGRPIQARIVLRQASLYAFGFQDQE